MAARLLFFIASARACGAHEVVLAAKLDSGEDSPTNSVCLLQTQLTLGTQPSDHNVIQKDVVPGSIKQHVAEAGPSFRQTLETSASKSAKQIRNQTSKEGGAKKASKEGGEKKKSEESSTRKNVFLVCGLIIVSGYLLSVAFGDDKRRAQADGKVDKSLRQSLPPALAWMVCSMTLTIFNKWIMIEDGTDFAFPAFMCMNHMLTCSVVLWTMRFARPDLFKGLVSLPAELLWPMLGPTFGIAAFMAVSIVCSNIAVKHLSVAFMNMLKAANPAYALVLAVLIGTMDSKGSVSKVAFAIFVMVGGAVINCFGELHLSFFGLFFFVIGIIFEQVRLVILKYVLSGSKLNWDPLSTLAVVSPFAFIFTAAICAVLESDKIPYSRLASDLQLQSALVMNGLVAAALNIAYVQLMDVISPVTYTVCGVAKDMVASISSLFLVGGSITPLQIVGYVISLAGFAYYDHIKTKQDDSSTSKAETPSTTMEADKSNDSRVLGTK